MGKYNLAQNQYLNFEVPFHVDKQFNSSENYFIQFDEYLLWNLKKLDEVYIMSRLLYRHKLHLNIARLKNTPIEEDQYFGWFSYPIWELMKQCQMQRKQCSRIIAKLKKKKLIQTEQKGPYRNLWVKINTQELMEIKTKYQKHLKKQEKKNEKYKSTKSSALHSAKDIEDLFF